MSSLTATAPGPAARVNALHSGLTGSLAHQISEGGRLTGAQVLRLPPPVRDAYQRAYVHSLSPVFVMAAGVAGLGFVLSLMLPERSLRDAAATSAGLEDGLAAPRSPDSLAEVEKALTRVTTREERMRFRGQIAERAGVSISPGAIWALVRIDEHGPAQARALAEADGITPARISEVQSELRERGLIAGEESNGRLTPAGLQETQRIVTARRQLLAEALGDDDPGRNPELDALLHRLARELCGEPPNVGRLEPAAQT